MNWITVVDNIELSEIMSNRISIVGEFSNGQIGYVYWNSYDWVINDTICEEYPDGISVSGKLVRYIQL
jgi:hypothetical protein